MSLLFLDGFDHYNPQQLNGFLPGAGWGKATYLSPLAQQVAGRRPTSKALRLANDGALNTMYYAKALSSPQTSLIIGMAFRLNQALEDLPLLTLITTTGQQFKLSLDSFGILSLQNAAGTVLSSSTRAFAFNSWHFIELAATASNSFVARVNGQQVFSTTASFGTFAALRLGKNAASNSVLDIDDLYVCNALGAVNNTFLGNVRIDTLYPNSDVATGWTSPVANHYSVINKPVPDLNTTLSAEAINLQDTYNFDDLPAIIAPAILGLQLNSLVASSDGSSATVKQLVQVGATTQLLNVHYLSSDFSYISNVLELNPVTNAAFTEANFNAAKFGLST